MGFLEDFKRLVLMGAHPCSCGALMELKDGMYICPECGTDVEEDAYGYFMDDVEKEHGFYDDYDEKYSDEDDE